MLVSLNSQAYIFLCTVLGGVIVGIIYDIFRISRKVFKTSNAVVYIEDIIFWLIVCAVIFGILFVSSAGQIRGYAILGILLGIILYACIASHYVMKCALGLINIIKRIIKFIYKTLKGPVILLWKIISTPFIWIYNLIKKISKILNKFKATLNNRFKLNIKNIKITLKKF